MNKGETNMTIQAKFPGTCRNCGGAIRVGQSIEWAKGAGAAHVKCNGSSPSVNVPTDKSPASIIISQGDGYGGRPFSVGETFAVRRFTREGPNGPVVCHGIAYRDTPETERVVVTVVRESQRYFREDGMSFGVGDESGYIYRADCREANADELTTYNAKKSAQKAKANAANRVKEIAKRIREQGEMPAGSNIVDGERLFDTQTIYGGGDWFVISPDAIWYVQNNGADGDDWSHNNVRTGGAGAMGWKIPFDAALADELKTLATKN